MTSAITVRAALEQAVRMLARNSDAARIEAETLLGYTLEKPRHYAYLWPEQLIAVAAHQRFEAFCRRRAAGEPLAYIVRRREFWSIDLEVTPATLIPRPETECLVEAALARIPVTADWDIVDLGTGSGAIALAIAKERCASRLLAADNSPEALAVAKRNANRLGIGNVRFTEGDWFAALDGRSYQMILSNPPYVADSDPHLQCGDLRFEPRSALAGGPDGMTEIRFIARRALWYLARHGRLLLEHGYDQGSQVCRLLEALGYRGIRSYRDYAGRQRNLWVKWGPRGVWEHLSARRSAGSKCESSIRTVAMGGLLLNRDALFARGPRCLDAYALTVAVDRRRYVTGVSLRCIDAAEPWYVCGVTMEGYRCRRREGASIVRGPH